MSELDPQHWRDDRQKFIVDDIDHSYSRESEYTFTGHYLHPRYIRKIYSIEADGQVKILSRSPR